MYPDWPESSADLVPLPNVEGPKLQAFDFQGPQKIEFLDYLGAGLHGHVVKVRILGRLYALKLFRFAYDGDWRSGWCPPYPDEPPGGYRGRAPPTPEEYELAKKYFSAFYSYSEPFSCECRAYGRLQETGHQELAIKAYGYVLIDEEHEKVMRAKYEDEEFDMDGSGEFPTGDGEQRNRFLGERSGKPPPILGIVKELGVPTITGPGLRASHIKRMLQDMKKLQQLGIISLDPSMRQLVNEKFSDFSTAITTPHPLMNPELNPNLDAAMVARMECETFRQCVTDYREFEKELRQWNYWNEDEGYPVPEIRVNAFERGGSWPFWREGRSMRSVGEGKVRFSTFVDPRQYDWKRHSGGNLLQAFSKKALKGTSKARVGKTHGPTRRVRLLKPPPRWCYETRGFLVKLANGLGGMESLNFDLKDGHIYPLLEEEYVEELKDQGRKEI